MAELGEEQITEIATVRITKLAPAAFLESNPGGDALIAERFAGKLAAEADRRFMNMLRGGAPLRPAEWPLGLARRFNAIR